MMKRIISKKGISIMVAYVLLIIIAITMSIIVYSWLKKQVPTDTDECEIDVSLIVEDYSCDGNKFELTIRNNGLFSVAGFYIRVSSDGVDKFNVSGGTPPNIIFDSQAPISGGLKPGKTHKISEIDYPQGPITQIDKITHIEIEPYMVKDEKVVLCGSSIVKISTDYESGCLGTIPSTIGYLDPNGAGVSSDWQCQEEASGDCSIGHYTVIDDGVRSDGTPGTIDYIYGENSAGDLDTFEFSSISVNSVIKITMWLYGEKTAGSPDGSINIYVDGAWGSTGKPIIYDVPASASWTSISWAGDWDQADIDDFQSRVFIVNGVGENFKIYEMYTEIEYT